MNKDLSHVRTLCNHSSVCECCLLEYKAIVNTGSNPTNTTSSYTTLHVVLDLYPVAVLTLAITCAVHTIVKMA